MLRQKLQHELTDAKSHGQLRAYIHSVLAERSDDTLQLLRAENDIEARTVVDEWLQSNTLDVAWQVDTLLTGTISLPSIAILFGSFATLVRIKNENTELFNKNVTVVHYHLARIWGEHQIAEWLFENSSIALSWSLETDPQFKETALVDLYLLKKMKEMAPAYFNAALLQNGDDDLTNRRLTTNDQHSLDFLIDELRQRLNKSDFVSKINSMIDTTISLGDDDLFEYMKRKAPKSDFKGMLINRIHIAVWLFDQRETSEERKTLWIPRSINFALSKLNWNSQPVVLSQTMTNQGWMPVQQPSGSVVSQYLQKIFSIIEVIYAISTRSNQSHAVSANARSLIKTLIRYQGDFINGNHAYCWVVAEMFKTLFRRLAESVWDDDRVQNEFTQIFNLMLDHIHSFNGHHNVSISIYGVVQLMARKFGEIEYAGESSRRISLRESAMTIACLDTDQVFPHEQLHNYLQTVDNLRWKQFVARVVTKLDLTNETDYKAVELEISRRIAPLAKYAISFAKGLYRSLKKQWIGLPEVETTDGVQQCAFSFFHENNQLNIFFQNQIALHQNRRDALAAVTNTCRQVIKDISHRGTPYIRHDELKRTMQHYFFGASEVSLAQQGATKRLLSGSNQQKRAKSLPLK